jgi:predicted nuclease of predicted toxin-antitoxin system
MEFEIDQNLPVEIPEMLSEAGYDAVTVAQQHFSGCSDDFLASVCKGEHRILITLDTDFADIRTYPPADFPGLIVLRLIQQDKAHVIDVVTRLLPLLSTEPLAHRFWIAEETRIRIRA